MLYDLAQDPRFVAVTRSQDPQLHHGLRPEMDQPLVVERQETILREASVRLRRYLGVSQDKRLNRPLIVVIPKFDIWQDMAGVSIETEPYAEANGSPLLVDTERVEMASNVLRALLARFAPEFVATAENLSSVVRYVPVSSLGCSPSFIRSRGKKGFYGVLPRDIHPKWVTVPLLYSLCKWSPGIVFGKPKTAEGSAG